MASWSFKREGRDVVVTYRDAGGSRERGRGEVRFLPDLVATVMCRAARWDQVRTEQGIFVKQGGPKGVV